MYAEGGIASDVSNNRHFLLRAGHGERFCHGTADATAGAGYECNLDVQNHVVIHLSVSVQSAGSHDVP